ncbi:MAG: LamG domain-containing protein, partial [Myxococcales bacterium]|nr:LamG domain-containing protein [Myxococcales bacterium]
MRYAGTPLTITALLLLLLGCAERASAQTSLRFYGNGTGDIDRVKIRIDDPSNAQPGPPADVGATDFTIELWLRGRLADNSAGAISCGSNINWINGNIVLDRDRYNQGRKYGLSLGAGRLAFGVTDLSQSSRTLCSSASVLDDRWHHVALQRRRADGQMWLYVDGKLEAQSAGPPGDISYPDDGTPGNYCGGPCTGSDPFLVIGAEKHDAGSAYPSFSGFVDELRISTMLRYSGASYVVPSAPFVSDANTAALYHFDEGQGDVIGDSSGAAGGPSDGVRRFGGTPAGPLWSSETPFSAPAADGAIDGPAPSRDGGARDAATDAVTDAAR